MKGGLVYQTTFVASLALAGLAGALASAPASALTVPRFGTAEIVLHSNVTYDAGAGTNPFDLVTTAKVVDPAGRSYAAEAFYDGDGSGGPRGTVWKLRIYADYPGTWRWSTT